MKFDYWILTTSVGSSSQVPLYGDPSQRNQLLTPLLNLQQSSSSSLKCRPSKEVAVQLPPQAEWKKPTYEKHAEMKQHLTNANRMSLHLQ